MLEVLNIYIKNKNVEKTQCYYFEKKLYHR